MDKTKVLEAYRRGFLSLRECAKMLGLDDGQISRLALEAAANHPHPQWKTAPDTQEARL